MDEVLGILDTGATDSHTDAGADAEQLTADRARLGKRGEDAQSDLLGFVGILDRTHQDRELVTGQARGDVVGAQDPAEAVGHVLQDTVAGGVTEAVVDELEAVEVDEQQRQALGARRGRHGLADALQEQRAVGQLREGVVRSPVEQLVFEHLALADVTDVEHDAGDAGLLEAVGADDLGVAPPAAAVVQTAGDRGPLRTALHELAEEVPPVLEVVRVDQVVEPRRGQRGGRVAQHPRDGRAEVADHAVGVDDGDHVGGVLHQRAEARLAADDILGQDRRVERQRGVVADDLERRLALADAVEVHVVGVRDEDRAAREAAAGQRDDEHRRARHLHLPGEVTVADLQPVADEGAGRDQAVAQAVRNGLHGQAAAGRRRVGRVVVDHDDQLFAADERTEHADADLWRQQLAAGLQRGLDDAPGVAGREQRSGCVGHRAGVDGVTFVLGQRRGHQVHERGTEHQQQAGQQRLDHQVRRPCVERRKHRADVGGGGDGTDGGDAPVLPVQGAEPEDCGEHGERADRRPQLETDEEQGGAGEAVGRDVVAVAGEAPQQEAQQHHDRRDRDGGLDDARRGRAQHREDDRQVHEAVVQGEPSQPRDQTLRWDQKRACGCKDPRSPGGAVVACHCISAFLAHGRRRCLPVWYRSAETVRG